MVQTGVMGYIPKESGSEELESALNTVILGKSYFPQASSFRKHKLEYQKNIHRNGV
jgi:DNA-binding NarL/FixJ family response regulator